MRFIFVKELIKYAKKNKDLYLVTADLGYRAFEDFKRLYPDRFINVGVAENNMIGVAAGLALTGKKVFVYSILPFLVFRSLEQIRNNICHNNLDVTLVGAGGGFSYGPQGISHNTSEDISIIRSLPNINVYNPGSRLETELLMRIIFKNKSPSFIRLGKCPDNDFYNKNIKLKNGEGLIIAKGNDMTIFTSGNILENVFNAVEKIKIKGFNVKLISLPIIKPVNEKFILANLNTKKILSIEENSIVGGLNSILSSIYVKKQKKNIQFKSIALKDMVHKSIGSQKHLRNINMLSTEKIYKFMIKYLNEKD
jgi:transketolase